MKRNGNYRDAVLVVDMQDYYLEKIAKSTVDEMIHAQVGLLEYCVKEDIPVAFIEDRDFDETREELFDYAHFLPTSGRFRKRKDNGFSNSNLTRRVREWGVGRIIPVGVNAAACVYRTADGGYRKGFDVATSSDLIADDEWGVKEYEELFLEIGDFYRSKDTLIETMEGAESPRALVA